MKITELGNIYSSGNAFTTRAALLQSVYRVEKELSIGETTVSIADGVDKNGKLKKKKVRKEYGHIVHDGENTNGNFYFPETFEYANKRVKNKKPEETIKADRLFNNLLSSMPLAFNLFHPLMLLHETNKNLINKIISTLFPDYNINEVEKIDIEYIPLPIAKYTNDKSAMDAVIFFKDNAGKLNIIAIEVKYTDSLGTNKASENDLKVKVAKETGYFTKEGIGFIDKGCMQIYRNFLLTEKYRIEEKLANSYSIILAPKDHPTTASEINSLKKYFSGDCPKNKLEKYSLEDFIKIISENISDINSEMDYKGWINWFYDRYLNFDKVEEFYKELKQK